jgi:predicted DsbA family dithiol-disulfide isomerase
MANESQDISPVFRIDVGQNASETRIATRQSEQHSELTALLQQLVVGQDRQNELLEEVVEQMGATQRQRAQELNSWKEANPMLAKRCRSAAESLSKVQTEFLHNVTCEVNDQHENMVDSEFVMNEFVDRFGPRLAHLNGVLQLLSQLSANPPKNPR